MRRTDAPSGVLDRPVIVIGAARSGTTVLGRMLAEHPNVAFWDEPNHIWRHGHAYRRSAVLTAADATPRVASYIRGQFARRVQQMGRQRFAEKTPSNCFRIPFIREVFPDARFVHLLRDGRAVAVSARLQWQRGLVVRRDVDAAGLVLNSSHGVAQPERPLARRLGDGWYALTKFVRDTRRFEGGPAVWMEAPASVPGAVRTVLRKWQPDRSFIWGPRFPGIEEVHRRCSLLETCALQWAFSVMAARAHLAAVPAAQRLEIHYQQLVDEPGATLARILEFADLPASDAVSALARTSVETGPDDRWMRTVTPQEHHLLDAWLAPLLHELGYATDTN